MTTTIEAPEQTAEADFVLPNPNLIEVDGLIIDTETGELVSGIETPEGSDIPESFILGLMRKLNRLESRAASAEASRLDANRIKQALVDEALAKIRATPEFMELEAVEFASIRLRERNQKAAEAIRTYFEDTFRTFATRELTGKERTWRSAFGNISLRKRPAEVVRPDAPDKTWFERLYSILPDAVKLSLALNPLKEGLKDATLAADLEPLGISLKEQPDALKVETALEAGAK